MARSFTDGELRRVLGDRDALTSTATRTRVTKLGDDDLRARLVRLTAALEAGEAPDAAAVQALAAELEAADDREAAAWAHRLASDVLLRSAHFEASLAAVDAALAVAPDDFPVAGALLVRRSIAEYRAGALAAAVRSVRNGYARAVGAGDDVTALWAVAYLSTYSFQIGHLRRAEALTDRVLEASEATTHALAGHRGPMVAMGWAVRAMVAAARGAWHDAAAGFDEAERICAEQSPWFAWIVRTYRGAALARYEPPMADAVLDELRAVAPDAGAELGWRFAHATGVAMAFHGELDAGVERMRQALADAEPPWERSVIALQLGEVLIDAGRLDEAADALRDAAAGFEAMDAPYWLARTWVGLARAVPDLAEGYLAGAQSFDDGDPAYGRLFEHRERLWIDVGKSPSVHLGEERVTFAGRQAEFTVYALALAGDAGVAVPDLVEVLWPSPDPARVPQRIRTLLWQVRKALGPESWRLQRVGDVLRLDLRGAHVAGLEPDTVLVELRPTPPGRTATNGVATNGAATNGVGSVEPGGHLLADWDHLGDDAQRWARALAKAAGTARRTIVPDNV